MSSVSMNATLNIPAVTGRSDVPTALPQLTAGTAAPVDTIEAAPLPVARTVSKSSKAQRLPYLRVPADRDTEHAGSMSFTVWNMAPYVREEPAVGVPGLFAIRANEVFSRNTFALQFGLPNVAMFEVNDKDEVYKVDAKSLHRAPTQVVNAHGKVQSGYYVVPLNLPEGAVARIREVAHSHQAKGSSDITCVHANTRILRDAGFTVGGRDPTTVMPYELLHKIVTKGFEYEHQPVRFDIARTTPLKWGTFMQKLPAAVRNTGCRHWANAYDTAEAREGRIHEVNSIREHRLVYDPPSVPSDAPTFSFSISKTSSLGKIARRAWGAHAVYKLDFSKSGIDVNEYLPRKLTAFSRPNPNLLTRVKKNFLFSKPVVKFVNKHMARKFRPQEQLFELDMTQLLKTHGKDTPNIFNVVVTSKEMIAGKLDVWAPKVDWVLSKHVLLSNYSKDVRFAGEMWKHENDCIHFNANSGTYTPTEEDLQNMLRLARRMFPNLNLQSEQIIIG